MSLAIDSLKAMGEALKDGKYHQGKWVVMMRKCSLLYFYIICLFVMVSCAEDRFVSLIPTQDEHEGDDGVSDDGSPDDGSSDDGVSDDGSSDDGGPDDGGPDDGGPDDGGPEDGVSDDGGPEDGVSEDGDADKVCAPGATLCFDDYMHVCADNVWKATESCLGLGCLDDVSCRACQEGMKKCENRVASVCTEGTWHTVECPLGCYQDACETVDQDQPSRYETDATNMFSPITPRVVQRMRDIASKNPSANSNVFMKVGDSHYAKAFDGRFMLCFSRDNANVVTLDGHTELQDTIDYFQSGSIDSYNRDSLAAVGGTATNYLFLSSKSYPLQSEIEAIQPRFAFFDHGTNDMGNGSYTHAPVTYTYNGTTATAQGYSWSLQDYYRQLNKAMDRMEASGIIPMITSIVPRHDTPSNINYIGGPAVSSTSDYPTHMVTAFNAVARGNAEARELPFFDAWAAFKTLPDEGISSDKVHASYKGSPCNFTSDGLKYGVNMRNYGSLTMLDKVWKALYQGKGGQDRVLLPFEGSGSQTDPFVISSLPYSHVADTSQSTNNVLQVYRSCSTVNEKGAEYYYKLVLTEKRRLRMFALSAATNIDVDIHVLRDAIREDACISRSDIMIQGTLNKGVYYISVDTYGTDTSNAGKYLLGIVECDADDHNCDTLL